MAMMPARVKYRKMHGGKPHWDCLPGNSVWRLGVRTAGAGALLDGHQADPGGGTRRDHALHEAARQVWIRIFPDKSFTVKPLEVRNGHRQGAEWSPGWR